MKKFAWILVLFAVILRFFLFFGVEKSLWLDEAALALNVLDKGYLELFQPLQYAQSAPPLFLCLTKLLVSVFGASERVFRFIPFVCSIASVFGFYYLPKIFLCGKMVDTKGFSAFLFVAAPLCLFCAGFPLLYNTIEFKPYMTDVLFTILTALIWFKYLEYEDVSLKKQIGSAFLLTVFPLFSFGSIFSVCAVLVLSLLKRRKVFCLILISGLLLEYLFIFSKISGGTRVYDYWLPYFIDYSPIKAVFVLSEIIRYQFYPSNMVLLGFIGFIAGCAALFRRDRKVFGFFGLIVFGGFLASFFNFYPLYDRLSLFLYPVMLVIIGYPLLCAMDDENKVRRFVIFGLSAVFWSITVLNTAIIAA